MRKIQAENLRYLPKEQGAVGLDRDGSGSALTTLSPTHRHGAAWLSLRMFFFALIFPISVFLTPSFTEGHPPIGLQLNKSLARPALWSWSDVPLRKVLDRFATFQRVPILVDRRVDPGQRTSLNAMSLPLGQAIDQLADMVNTKAVPFGSLIYLGPEEAARLLPVLATARREEVRTMADRGRAMLTPKPMQWDDLATPRELLQKLADEAGVSIGPIESIPHDLWAAADLPSATVVDRLTLILLQFDKTFSVSNSTDTTSTDAQGKPRLVIVDIPEEVKASVRTAESEAEAKRPKTPKPRGPMVDLARMRITHFAVKEKPVSVVIEYLARQWNLTLDVDRRKLRAKLAKRINILEENVTIPELIDAVLEPAGLKGEVDVKNGVLKITNR